MGNKKLTISLVTWNGEKYLPLLFNSLKKQTFQDFDIVVLDNGSSDKTVEILKQVQSLPSTGLGDDSVDVFDNLKIIKKDKNTGFAGGHNEIFEKNDSEYFLVLNQDIFLKEDVLEKMVKFMDENEDIASVAPKLNKWVDPSVIPAQAGIQDIDSLGLKVLKNRRVIENKGILRQAQDDPDTTSTTISGYGASNKVIHDDKALEVFGVSGACAIYRRESIQDVGGLFDDDYFAYKEDVDLGYRLRQRGLKSCVLLNAQAWHDRTGSEKGKTDINQAENKKKQTKVVKYYSYRNHLMTIYKNEYWQNFTIDFLPILWYELKKFIWFLLFDRAILKVWKEIWEMRKELKQKRKEVIKIRKLNWKQMRKVFTL